MNIFSQDIFEGTLILNGGYDFRSGNEVIEKDDADLISFGVLFLANPDLPERFMKNAPLNQVDVATFYMDEEKGYNDFSNHIFFPISLPRPTFPSSAA